MSVKTQREMLEAAIAADFDDLAAHAAYADLLAEEGDPRGEYIQLQLALENKDQSPRLLAEWRDRANRLYRAHERDWLGTLAPFLLGRGPSAARRYRVPAAAHLAQPPSASCLPRLARARPAPAHCA